MELIIAEKPSVARDLARVLGVPAKGPGSWRGGGRIVTWCLGHLVELDEPAAYDPAWKRWRLESLPMLPPVFKLRPTGNAGARAQWRVVRDLLRSREVTSVVNACDAGREGELIFRYCLELAGARLPVRRLWISSLTDAAIRAGFARLAPGAALEPLADAARCRSEADWLVGMNATRAVTVKSRGAGGESLMSIGRVQTPTLALIVERERAIRAFVAVRYAEVQGTFSAGTAFVGTWSFGGRSRLVPGLDAAVIARVTGKPARVERVERVVEREPPPLLFDLTGLQRTANKRHGFSAKKTLDLAQSLYEKHKLLSYPRTDSRHLPNDVRAELPAVFEALSRGALAGFAQRAAASLAGGARFGRVFDDRRVSDHHAIIPTAKPPDLARGTIDGDERRIYELVARRFLGAFFPDAEIARTTVGILVGAPGPLPKPAADRDELVAELPPPPDRFVARGRVRLVAGWQEVAGFEGPTDDEQALPPLAVGEPLAARYAALAKQTQPPRRFTEATLLAAMEAAGKEISDDELRLAMKDRGLGTPATRAATIETLLDRRYLERAGKALAPTPLGEGLIARLPVESLASAELTGRWEARLARMARGEPGESRAAFMADIRAYVAEVVAAIVAAPAATRTAAVAETEATPVGFCPLCRGGVVEKFKFFACGGCAFKLWKSIAGKRISATLAGVILRAGRTRELPGFRSKAGKRFAAAIVLDETGATKLVFEGRGGEAAPAKVAPAPARVAKPAKVAKPAAALPVCPRCKHGHLVVGKRAWGCSRWREGCPLVIPFAPAGKPLTRAQLERLVSHGVTRKTTAGRVRLDAAATPPTVSVESG